MADQPQAHSSSSCLSWNTSRSDTTLKPYPSTSSSLPSSDTGTRPPLPSTGTSLPKTMRHCSTRSWKGWGSRGMSPKAAT